MRICSGPGCLRTVQDSVRFCDECKPKPVAVSVDDIRSHTTAYDAELDKLNKGTRWQQLRARILKKQPICARCDRELSAIADHIVPAREAISQARLSGAYLMDKFAGYFFDTNLQGLCRSCHWTKTNEDKMHTGPWPDVVAAEKAKPKKVYRF